MAGTSLLAKTGHYLAPSVRRPKPVFRNVLTRGPAPGFQPQVSGQSGYRARGCAAGCVLSRPSCGASGPVYRHFPWLRAIQSCFCPSYTRINYPHRIHGSNGQPIDWSFQPPCGPLINRILKLRTYISLSPELRRGNGPISLAGALQAMTESVQCSTDWREGCP